LAQKISISFLSSSNSLAFLIRA